MSTHSKKLIQWNLAGRFFSDSTLTKKAYLNALAVLIDYSARLLVGFIVTPLLVAGLGTYTFGIWQIISRLTSYLTAATGRPTQALKWTIASLQSSDDFAEKRRFVGSAVTVWFIYMPVFLGLGGVFVWYLPDWFAIDPSLVSVARVATWLLVTKMTLTSLVMIPESILQGENSGYKRIGLSTSMVVVGGGLTILALHLDTGLIGVACAAVVTSLLTGLTYLSIARKFVPWIGFEWPRRIELKRFLALSGWFLIWRLIMKLMTASDVILLGAFVSVESVTIYSLTKYVPETLVGLLADVVFGMSPGIGGIVGSGDLRKASLLRNEVYLFTWFSATLIGTVILLWNEAFLTLWVGSDHFTGPATNFFIVLMMIQFVLIRIESNFIDLTLNLKGKVLFGLISVCLSIGLALTLILYAELGVMGLCIGFILGRLMLSFGYPVMIGRLFEISLWHQIRRAFRPILLTVVLLLGAATHNIYWHSGDWFTADSWLGLGAGIFATAALLSVSVISFGLSAPQRNLLIQRVSRAIS